MKDLLDWIPMPIRPRFEPAQIKALLALRWWELPD